MAEIFLKKIIELIVKCVGSIKKRRKVCFVSKNL